jgi:hypothetical protein
VTEDAEEKLTISKLLRVGFQRIKGFLKGGI